MLPTAPFLVWALFPFVLALFGLRRGAYSARAARASSSPAASDLVMYADLVLASGLSSTAGLALDIHSPLAGDRVLGGTSPHDRTREGGLAPPNKRMQLTKLRAAPVRQAEVPPVPPPARWTGAPLRS